MLNILTMPKGFRFFVFVLSLSFFFYSLKAITVFLTLYNSVIFTSPISFLFFFSYKFFYIFRDFIKQKSLYSLFLALYYSPILVSFFILYSFFFFFSKGRIYDGRLQMQLYLAERPRILFY